MPDNFQGWTYSREPDMFSWDVLSSGLRPMIKKQTNIVRLLSEEIVEKVKGRMTGSASLDRVVRKRLFYEVTFQQRSDRRKRFSLSDTGCNAEGMARGVRAGCVKGGSWGWGR